MKTDNLEYTGEALLNELSLRKFEEFFNSDVLSGYKEYTSVRNQPNFKKAFLGGIILVTLTTPNPLPTKFSKSTDDITQIVKEVNTVKNKFKTDKILKSIIDTEEIYVERFEDFSHKILPAREYIVTANIISIEKGKPDPIDPEYLI